MNLLQNKKIAIVGGGPGGLTLARLLQLKGANVTVYERDLSREARVQGSIVDLHFESGLKALEKAGLIDAFKANYMPGADKFRIVDKQGTIRYDEHEEVSSLDFGNEAFRPEIDRGALRNLLLDSLESGTVVWDSHFKSMQQVNGVWTLEFKNGTTAIADIVIGSDGARSGIRSYITDIEALYSGITIIQGEVDNPESNCPEMNALISKANLAAFGDGKTINAQPRDDGGITFYAAAKYPENWAKTSGIDFNDEKQVYNYLVEFYEGWNPVFFTLFNACDKLVARPLNYVPADQNWEAQSNITLIGDAAHLMPPSGEGVNLAMLDALELSEALADGKFDTTQSAIAVYEKQMRERAKDEAKDALEGILGMHSENALEETILQFNEWRA